MKYNRIIRYSGMVIVGAILFFGALFLIVFFGVFGHLSSVEELKNSQNYLSSEVYSSDHVLLGKYYLQDRTNVHYNDLPTYLLEALVATEDVRFYEHEGIDTRSALRGYFQIYTSSE